MRDDRNAVLLLHTCCSSPIHFSVCWLICCGIYFNLHDFLEKPVSVMRRKTALYFFSPDPSDCICASSALKTSDAEGLRIWVPNCFETLLTSLRHQDLTQLQHKLQDPAFTPSHASPCLVRGSEGVT